MKKTTQKKHQKKSEKEPRPPAYPPPRTILPFPLAPGTRSGAAFIADEDEESSSDKSAIYYVLLVLPALLVVVDSLDTFLRTAEAANGLAPVKPWARGAS